jgi:arylsulfatase A-like enzyme
MRRLIDLLLLVVSLVLLLRFPLQLAAQTRPDIVVFITDDEKRSDLPHTPLVRELIGDAGVVFKEGMTHSALCDPSRATLLSGLYVYHHGVTNNEGPTNEANFDWRKAFSRWLHNAGYRTVLVGKDFADSPFRAPIPGWDVFHNEALNQDIRDIVLNEVDATPLGQPLLLYVGWHWPHYPSIPDPADAGTFAGQPPWRPPDFNEADVSDKPLWVRNLPLLSRANTDSIDAFRRRRLESLQRVDRDVRDILAELEARGRPSPVVIFVSDHGLGLGEHRIFDRKICPYQECVRIPFLVRAPDAFPHIDTTHEVSLVDVAATIADFAGVIPPTPLDGISFRSLLVTGVAYWPNGSLHMVGTGNRHTEAVRTPKWTYVELTETGERELYDGVSDPFQLRNVADQPAYAAIQSELKARLDELRAGAR